MFQPIQTKGGHMRFLSSATALGLVILSTAAAPPARAALVDVNMYGTVASGGTITGQSFAGQSVRVSFSYDTNTIGVGGVFSGGINFLNPTLYLNSTRYVNFTDELAPLHPTTVTLVNGAPDTMAVDFDMDGYVGITNRTEALTLNFAGASDFLSSAATLPASANVLGSGTGSFSLLYADDCQNYACGPGGIFFAGASFSIDRLQIGVSAVPEPSPLALLALGGLGMAMVLRRRMHR
jgi:PEP-CTERM motif